MGGTGRREWGCWDRFVSEEEMGRTDKTTVYLQTYMAACSLHLSTRTWNITSQRTMQPKRALQLLFQNMFQFNRNLGFHREGCTKDSIMIHQFDVSIVLYFFSLIVKIRQLLPLDSVWDNCIKFYKNCFDQVFISS